MGSDYLVGGEFKGAQVVLTAIVKMFATVMVMVAENVVTVEVEVTTDVGRTVDEVRLRHLHAAETTSQAK